MTDNDMNEQGQPSCPITPMLAELVENADFEGGEQLGRHALECPSCMVEAQKILAAQKQDNLGWLKRLVTGLGVLAGVALLMGMKGFYSSVNESFREKGFGRRD